MIKTPRPYQQVAIERGANHNLLITDEMGLGKTLEAIEICKRIHQRINLPALIVCPANLINQWHMMINEQDPESKVWIIANDTQPNDLSFIFDYYITNYEQIVKHVEFLSRLKWSTLVIDEAHRIKNRVTQNERTKINSGAKKIHRTLAIKKLNSYRRLALTGTPFDKDPSEYWSILNYLSPTHFSSYWRFVEEHIDFDQNYWGQRSHFRLRNPKAFTQALAPYVIGRKKRDVMPELPPLQITRIPITLAADQQKAYDKMRAVIAGEIEFEGLEDPLIIQNHLTKLTRLLQIASDPNLLDINASSAKVLWLQEWVADNQAETVIIFTRYRKLAQKLHTLLDADTLVIGGSPLSSQLTTSRRIVATIAAGGTGLDLGHVQNAIFVDSDWSSITMDQAMQRIDRGNNQESKQVIFLDAIATVDRLVETALLHKLNTKQIIERFVRNATA